MKVFTLGFTKKSAEQFFACLKQPGLQRVIDTRLNNVSQLSGFTKKEDLNFFLRELGHVDYVHLPALAPTRQMLDAYQKKGGDWDSYARQFLALMAERRIETTIDKNLIAGACLLCSEPTPHHCHRRLVAEYLRENWGDVDILHL